MKIALLTTMILCMFSNCGKPQPKQEKTVSLSVVPAHLEFLDQLNYNKRLITVCISEDSKAAKEWRRAHRNEYFDILFGDVETGCDCHYVFDPEEKLILP